MDKVFSAETVFIYWDGQNYQRVYGYTIDGRWWFLGWDIARIMGLKTAGGEAYRNCLDTEKRTESVTRDSISGDEVRRAVLLSESGVIALAAQVRHEAVIRRRFLLWFTRDVLMEIYKEPDLNAPLRDLPMVGTSIRPVEDPRGFMPPRPVAPRGAPSKFSVAQVVELVADGGLEGVTRAELIAAAMRDYDMSRATLERLLRRARVSEAVRTRANRYYAASLFADSARPFPL